MTLFDSVSFSGGLVVAPTVFDHVTKGGNSVEVELGTEVGVSVSILVILSVTSS